MYQCVHARMGAQVRNNSKDRWLWRGGGEEEMSEDTRAKAVQAIFEDAGSGALKEKVMCKRAAALHQQAPQSRARGAAGWGRRQPSLSFTHTAETCGLGAASWWHPERTMRCWDIKAWLID